ncbi:hypothetical protein ACTMU2_00885 [Cupriavidus basilensis]
MLTLMCIPQPDLAFELAVDQQRGDGQPRRLHVAARRAAFTISKSFRSTWKARSPIAAGQLTFTRDGTQSRALPVRWNTFSGTGIGWDFPLTENKEL